MRYSSKDNIFEIKPILNDGLGVPPFLSTHRSFDDIDIYKKKIFKNTLANEIQVKLELNCWKGGNLKMRDFHRWDLGSPIAYRIVCSPRFRSVLEKLNLPPHRFYNAEIDVLGKVENYFVLHFIFEYLDEMNFYPSQFAQAELMKTEPIEKLFAKGEIASKDQFNQLNVKLIDEDRWIYPRHIVLPTSAKFDVFSLGGSIVLSENAKTEIEKAGITGVVMPHLWENKYWNGVEIEFADLPISKPQTTVYQPNEEATFIVAEPLVEYKNNKKNQ